MINLPCKHEKKKYEVDEYSVIQTNMKISLWQVLGLVVVLGLFGFIITVGFESDCLSKMVITLLILVAVMGSIEIISRRKKWMRYIDT